MSNAKFISTGAIITALKTFLESLKAPEGNKPLFEIVRPYDSTQINKAFADLLIENERRLCFIVPGRQGYEHAREGQKLRVAKAPQFLLLICDTDRETGHEAMFGGPDNIGVIGINDIVVNALAGETLGIQGVVISPIEGDDLLVYDESKPTDSGRKGWLLVIETPAGIRNVPLPRG